MSEEIEFVELSVGNKFTLFQESTKRLKGNDGAFFEASDFNQGYMYCIYLTNVTFMDKNAFQKKSIEIRILEGGDNLVLPMAKFGTEFTFEMSFDPTLYEDERSLQFVETNNMLTMFLIDSDTGTIKAIRQANMPLKMIQICRIAWSKAILDVNFSSKYTEWFGRMRKYPLEVLWDRATKVGRMGETFNLDEIKYPVQKDA